MAQLIQRSIAVSLIVVGILVCACHAISPLFCVMGFLALLGLSYRYESTWLISLPTILVLGAWYPLTGSIVFQEYDIGLCGVLAGRLLNGRLHWSTDRWQRGCWLAIACLFVVGGIRGWLYLPASGMRDQLRVYTSQLNTYQQLKVLLYGLAIVPLIGHELRRGREGGISHFWRPLELGMLISAVGVCMMVALERLVTVGMWDFEQELRVCGPCTSMHIGDQHIDAYWAFALPFVFQFRYRWHWATLGLCALQAASIYVIFATMSRATIAAAAMTLLLLAAGRIMFLRDTSALTRYGKVASQATVVLGVCAAAIIGLLLWSAGSAVPKRFADSLGGWQTRLEHWSSIAKATGQSTVDRWLGTGLGSYPLVARRVAGRPEQPIGLVSGDSVDMVRLYADEHLYFEQWINPSAPLPWQFSAQVRSSSSGAAELFLCKKVMLQSYDCVQPSLQHSAGVIQGMIREVPGGSLSDNQLTGDVLPVAGADVKDNSWRHWCPTTFGFAARGGPGDWVEIGAIQVLDAEGNVVLRNGDLSAGSLNWFFTCDDHLIWRAKNCWLHIAVEFGVLGVLAGCCLCVLCANRLVHNIFTGHLWPSLMVFAVLLNFFVVAQFGTLVDVPWIEVLLVVFLGCASFMEHP